MKNPFRFFVLLTFLSAIISVPNTQWAQTNNSALFEGSGARIRITDAAPINPSAIPGAYKITGTSITVEAWVYPLNYPNPGYGNTIVERGLNSSSTDNWLSYRLWISNTGGIAHPAFSISDGTLENRVTVLSPDILPAFQWTHIAGTYDGASLKIYVNGVFKSTVNTNISINSTPGVGFYIGRFLTDGFSGVIDDVRLWNITRSEAEINSNMNNVLEGTESGLAGYWNLDAKSIINNQNVVSDKTANHNDLIAPSNSPLINFNPLTTYGVTTYTVSPASFNIGTLEQGTLKSVEISFSNTGSYPLIGCLELDSPDMLFNSRIFYADPGQTFSISTWLVPRSKGPFNVPVPIQSNGTGDQNLYVTGTSISLGQFDANNIVMWTRRNGSFAFNPMTLKAGLEWIKGSGKTAVFSSGIWIGANVDGNVRTAASFYSSEFLPGPIVNGLPANPNDFTYRVYKIQTGDNAGNNPDYASWPVGLGAPINADGSPKIIGDQTLFSVYNDLNSGNHYLGSQPLGAEVQQTIFGFNQPGVLSNTVFLRFKIINKSSSTWNNTYISLWSDPDLGNPYDDLCGSDTSRNMGFVYNGSNTDQVYGTPPPALGYQVLKGAFFTKPIQGFSYFTAGATFPMNDPNTALGAYNFMQGKWSDGTPYIDPGSGLATTFALNGDPAAGTGWIDSSPNDRRFLLSTGPFDLEPGQSKEFIASIVLAQGASNLNSISALQSAADVIQNLFNSGQLFGGALQNIATLSIPAGTTGTLDDISNSGAQITVTGGTGGAVIEAASYVGPPPGALDITTPSITSVGKYLEIDAGGTVVWPIPIRIYYTKNDLQQAGIVESDLAGIYYWKGLTNQWNLYSNSGPDDQGRGTSTTSVDTVNVIINGIHYEGYASASAFHLTQIVLAARKISISERYNSTIQFIQSLPNNVFKFPALLRKAELVTMISISKLMYNFGRFESAARYLEKSVLNHLSGNGRFAHDLWVTDDASRTTLVRMINDIIEMLLRPHPGCGMNENSTNPAISAKIPTEFELSQNYPNPFNPATKIKFGLPESAFVNLIVYDALGREVMILRNEEMSAGYHEVTFNGSNLTSGVYIYRLITPKFTSSKKLVLIK